MKEEGSATGTGLAQNLPVVLEAQPLPNLFTKFAALTEFGIAVNLVKESIFRGRPPAGTIRKAVLAPESVVEAIADIVKCECSEGLVVVTSTGVVHLPETARELNAYCRAIVI